MELTQGTLRAEPVGASPEPAKNRYRTFVLASIGAAVPVVAITALLATHIGGADANDEIKDFGQAVAALAAALSLANAAWRAPSRTRWAWILLSASGATAFAGEVIQVVWHQTVFPTADDLGLLIAILLASAGLLAFPAAKNIYASRLRTSLDFLMVAFSLAFVAVGFGLPQEYAHGSLSARWVGPLFPAGDVLLLTVLFVMLRRNRPTRRGRTALLLIGFAINAISDSANTFVTAHNLLPSDQVLFGVGSMYGFTLVALAPLWPRGVDRPSEVGDAPLWQVLMPYAGVVVVLSTAIGAALAHQILPASVDVPSAGLVLVLIVSQVLTFMEGRSYLKQSRRDQAMLKERETMLNNVIDHAPQGVARITYDQKVANSNPRLASILYSPKRLVDGSTLDRFLPPDDVKRAFGSFASVFDGSNDTFETDSRARRAEGSEFWMHWTLTPIRKPDGTIDYYMAMFEDVTAKRESEETASANLQQLEKLNRLKSEFVSMVSHEFRTALVGIQGFSELIRDEDLETSDVKSLAGDINKDAERLNRMISEMLEFDRMEAGKIRLDLKPLDINELIRGAVDRAQITTTKHDVIARLQSDLPEIIGDADRLIQVLTNLLSNAIKYSPDGGEILVRSGLDGGNIQVSIKDHGLGIAPEFIGRLFGRYERYEDKHVGKIIGTGLGLAITRQIVEMHGGKISVESTVGNGSEFKFTLPVSGRVVTASRI